MALVWGDTKEDITVDLSWKRNFWHVKWKKVDDRHELRGEYLAGIDERIAVVFKRKLDKKWRVKVYMLWSSRSKRRLISTEAKFKTVKDGKGHCEKVLAEYFKEV